MRIGIDVQTLETNERTRGIGKLCERTVQLLTRFAPANRYVLFGLGEEPPPQVKPFIGNSACYAQISLDDPAAHLRHGCAAPFLWEAARDHALDVYHVTSPLMPDILLPGWSPCPVVATLLDAIPAAMQEAGTPMLSPDDWARYSTRANLLQTYQGFLPISRSAADDCARLLSLPAGKMLVTYVPIDQLPGAAATSSARAAVLARYGLREQGFIATVSGYNPRKNLDGTLRSYAHLPLEIRNQVPLVVICALTDTERESLLAIAKDLGIASQVLLTGYVSDDDLVALVKSAAVFLFLSLYEGFGIPAAEAMACGTPVIASNTSSLPEIVGNAGVLINPADEPGVSQALIAALKDRKAARKRGAAGAMHVAQFSPDRYARALIKGYESAIERQVRNVAVTKVSPGKIRVANFGPLSPRMSGVADYNEQLILHLSPDFEVDCFIEDYSPALHLIHERVNCFEHTAFMKRHAANPYDVALYHVGNNLLHSYELPYVTGLPGLTVLHDASLLDVYRHAAFNRGICEAVRERFEQEYPDSDDSAWDSREASNRLDAWEYPMIRTVLEESRITVVHSHWLKQRLELVSEAAENIHVLPMGFSRAWVNAPRPSCANIRNSLMIPPDAFVVTSVGVINRLKRLREVLEAFNSFHTIRPNSYFVLIGPADPVLFKQLSQAATAGGLKHYVRFLGHRELTELYDVVSASDVCVNLRYPSMGETSATLVLALAMGRPVLTTQANQYNEYPDSVCWKVRLGDTERREMVEYLRILHDEPAIAEQLGRNARKYVDDWPWEKTARKYANLLRQIAETNRAGAKLTIKDR